MRRCVHEEEKSVVSMHIAGLFLFFDPLSCGDLLFLLKTIGERLQSSLQFVENVLTLEKIRSHLIDKLLLIIIDRILGLFDNATQLLRQKRFLIG